MATVTDIVRNADAYRRAYPDFGRTQTVTPTERPPSKRWRVRLSGGGYQDFRSERAAYEAAQVIVGSGFKTTIRHWEDGRWIRFDELEPDAPRKPKDGE